MAAWGEAIARAQLLKLLFDHTSGNQWRKLSGFLVEGGFEAVYHAGEWQPVGSSPAVEIPDFEHELTDSKGSPLKGAGLVCAVLQRRLNRALEQALTVRIRFEQGRWKQYRVPVDLRAAAALQMAEALTGDRTFVRCAAPDCQRYMEITGSRSDKQMHERCSRRWRMRRWREKDHV
jgi:hypothetical protein